MEPEIDDNHLDRLQEVLEPEEFQGYLLFEIHRKLWRYDQKPNKIKDLETVKFCIERLIQSLQGQK